MAILADVVLQDLLLHDERSVHERVDVALEVVGSGFRRRRESLGHLVRAGDEIADEDPFSGRLVRVERDVWRDAIILVVEVYGHLRTCRDRYRIKIVTIQATR